MILSQIFLKIRNDGFEIIIVDTSGRHSQEEGLFLEMQAIRDEINPDNIIFTLDGTQGQSIHSQAEGFLKFPI